MISDSSFMPLKADCINDTPLDELLTAVLMLRSWDNILEDTERPAASSAAELTRSPDDSLVIDC
jgi:hypothetical protein